MELPCFFHLTTIIHIHTHTPRHSQNTSTDRSPSLKMLNYIFKPQQLDIICLLKRAGSSWVSIYTQTHTHTPIYIYTHQYSMSVTTALTWLGFTTSKHLRFFCFQLQSNYLWSFGAFRSHNIKNHSNITTNIYLYC